MHTNMLLSFIRIICIDIFLVLLYAMQFYLFWCQFAILSIKTILKQPTDSFISTGKVNGSPAKLALTSRVSIRLHLKLYLLFLPFDSMQFNTTICYIIRLFICSNNIFSIITTLLNLTFLYSPDTGCELMLSSAE